MLRTPIVLTTLAALTAVPLPSRATPPRAQLTTSRAADAEACPNTATLQATLTARMGRNPTDPAATRAVHVAFARTASAYTAQVRVREPGAPVAVRELTGDPRSCDKLSDAVVLAVALAIDPLADLPATPVAPTSTPHAVTPAVAPPTMEPVAWSSRQGVASGVVFAPGVVPPPGPGWTLSYATPRVWRIRGVASALLVPESPSSDPHLGFSFAGGTLHACIGVWNDRWSADFCAGAWLGGVTAATYHPVDALAPGTRVWGAASISAQGSVRLVGPLGLVLAVDLLVPFTPMDFFIRNRPEPTFSQASVTVAPSFALSLRFP